MAEFATKGVAGTGLGLGIAGTALGLLNNGSLGNLLGGIVGGANPNAAAMEYLAMMGAFSGAKCCCLAYGVPVGYGGIVSSDDQPVNRYEAGKDARIAELETEVKLRDANTFTMGEMNLMRNYVDGQFREIRDSLCGQAVINQKTVDGFERVHDDLMCVKGDLEGKIAAERAARCCSDNAIVTYANATFYPKLVAGVTPTTETTAQTLYNPVTNCGCSCGNG